jgi:hypothetical protein
MKEKFTTEEVKTAIEQWLEFGERSDGNSHQGYFSGEGWAARALRYALSRMLDDLQDYEQEDKINKFPYTGDSDAYAV